ncbi:PEP-CTERM sorting domain-containing protein [Nitrosospira sp. Is2]|uniref:PEP-CTERM sorting domain-containing protein n=1 Tax=Nitrosospira sp. Is2 TaxID=3080532 RepID=UPI002952C33D|nr:PEP-CTERM sorting domain-containing protein [Nitrosospira sp. Is2]WON72637.1 PEP-CTERM sorting domain-containing protein [Nitrosospira sp. Is2]
MKKINFNVVKENANPAVNKRKLRASHFALASFLMIGSCPGLVAQAHADSFERLSSLLAATPEGGWVKASTGFFWDAWPTGADAVPGQYGWPGAIVRAWSSFAWDSSRGDLMLWGGGHANYTGNEMYVWDGATGSWGRGSLPSRTDSQGMVLGGTAPQSAHTYDNNIYLPVNDMFLTFGGAASGTGSVFRTTEDGNIRRAGPYLWDPAKADANKVGGTLDSGWNTANPAQNGDMWIDRHGQWTGTEAPGYINGTTAYRTENGKDVVYLTADSNASGFASLYRYTLGDVRNGGKDTWEQIGIARNTAGYQGAATLDTDHNLYIKTAAVTGPYTSDLTIWDLDRANANNPSANQDIGINLVNQDGSNFTIHSWYGIAYNAANDTIVLWDGNTNGSVWSANVLTDANGDIGSNTTWTVSNIDSSTSAHPNGSFATGVLGKWQYDSTLGAFIALDEFARMDNGAWDTGVWLYKPMSALNAPAVPEPETYAMFLAGLAIIGGIIRRRGVRLS